MVLPPITAATAVAPADESLVNRALNVVPVLAHKSILRAL